MALSSIFFILNVLAVPRSYSTLHAGRMLCIFPMFEAGMFAMLVSVYVLFYRGIVIILEYEELQERTRLFKMQSRQYRVLKESAPADYCANAAVNALFGYYHGIAAFEGIRTDWHIELPDPLPFSELDMAALFGNLMENAIAGCRTACLDARFDGKVRKVKDGYRSTKHSGNGIRLSAITATAEKYGGSAKASHSGTEFFVDVTLKL